LPPLTPLPSQNLQVNGRNVKSWGPGPVVKKTVNTGPYTKIVGPNGKTRWGPVVKRSSVNTNSIARNILGVAASVNTLKGDGHEVAGKAQAEVDRIRTRFGTAPREHADYLNQYLEVVKHDLDASTMKHDAAIQQKKEEVLARRETMKQRKEDSKKQRATYKAEKMAETQRQYKETMEELTKKFDGAKQANEDATLELVKLAEDEHDEIVEKADADLEEAKEQAEKGRKAEEETITQQFDANKKRMNQEFEESKERIEAELENQTQAIQYELEQGQQEIHELKEQIEELEAQSKQKQDTYKAMKNKYFSAFPNPRSNTSNNKNNNNSNTNKRYNSNTNFNFNANVNQSQTYKAKRMVPAKASFVKGTQKETISIVINGEPVMLSKDDCITFIRDVAEGENPLTTAKILGFGYSGDFINRIFFLPWRKEGRWGSHTLQQREIGLEFPYLGGGGADWTSIVKLDKCPD